MMFLSHSGVSRVMCVLLAGGLLASGCVADSGGLGQDPPVAEGSGALGVSGAYGIAASLPSRAYYSVLNVLASGQVLEVDWPRVAWLYNPTANQWSPAAAPPVTVSPAPVSGRLPDGRVVVIDAASAQIYEPANNSWSTAGGWGASNNHDRGRGLVLQSGKVLIAGGDVAGLFYTNTAHLFDPVTRSWRSTGNMLHGRAAFAIARLHNGKILVAGGNNGGRKAELYDPATGGWSATGDTVVAHDTTAKAVTLVNGKVLLRSFSSANAGTSVVELYDPGTGTWSVTGTPTGAGIDFTALPTGKVLLQNGATSELYDPTSGTWALTGSPNAPRISSTAVMNNGGVLLVGGMLAVTPGCAWNTCVEIYNP